MSSTILVIGARSALAKDAIPLLAQGNKVITAGRQDCDVYCDITESVTIPAGVDTVINFAASFGGSTDEEIDGAVQTNVLGTLRVCEAARKAGVKHIVHISSIFTVLDETSPSYSIYAITKKHGDELAVYFCKQNNMPLTILRPSRIYGDSRNFQKHQPFLYHLADTAQKGEDIAIYGSNDASRNYIHSADLCEIIARVVALQLTGIYGCTYPSNTTYASIARAAQKASGRGGQVTFTPDKPDIPDDTFPLDQSLYEKIGYSPQISMEEGMRRIRNYRQTS